MAASTARPSVKDIESLMTEYYAAWGGTDEDRIMSYYADNVTVQIPGALLQGKSAVRKQFVRPFITGFPGNRHVIQNMIFQRDGVVVEFTFDAEHKGSFAGRGATDAHVQMPGCGVYECDSARRQITAARIYFDVQALLQQITDPSFEKALRESEAKFRDYAETASDWFWEIDPDYKFTLLTENAFGFDAAHRIGTACWEHALDFETEPEKWRVLKSTLDSRQPFRDFVYCSVDGSGSPIYVRASGKPVFASNGEFLGYRGTGTDVTAIIRAQEALRESEQSLRSALDGIPGLVAILGPDGGVEVVNRQIVDYCGQPLDELKHWGTNGTVHHEDLPYLAEGFGKSIASGIPYQFEIRLRRFDGEYRWFDNRGIPFRDDSGRVVRWYVLLTDINERKRAEQALQSNERNLSLIINTIPTHIYVLNTEGSVQYVNQAVMDYTGLTMEDVQQEDYRDRVIHPEDFRRVRAGRAASLKQGAPFSTEQRVLSKDGQYRSFSVRYKPLLDEQGGIVRWYVAASDIEDRKRAEQALLAREAELRRANQYLTSAQELSKTGSYTRDLMTDEQNLSDQMYRICEFDPAKKVTHEMVLSRIHPEDRPTFDAAQKAAHAAGEDFRLTYRFVTDSGAVKHFRTVSRRLTEVTDHLVYVGATQDVTESKVAEGALNTARAELTHAARVMTLGALTASIAHEVNQPLSGIITNASTCLRMLGADPPNLEGAKATAQRTLRDGNRASEIVQRLRAMFAHKERTAESVDLNEAAREVLTLSSSELQRRGVVLRTDFNSGLPAINGDRVQLQQVILNLVLNAADAMKTVDDRTRNLLVATARDDADWIRLSVRDSGVGIDPQKSDKLFEPFFTTKSTGMGVGLSISRSIIESHEGRLWATANDGPGATFSFAIPCRSEPSHVMASSIG